MYVGALCRVANVEKFINLKVKEVKWKSMMMTNTPRICINGRRTTPSSIPR